MEDCRESSDSPSSLKDDKKRVDTSISSLLVSEIALLSHSHSLLFYPLVPLTDKAIEKIDNHLSKLENLEIIERRKRR